jgi:hypothetical protein
MPAEVLLETRIIINHCALGLRRIAHDLSVSLLRGVYVIKSNAWWHPLLHVVKLQLDEKLITPVRSLWSESPQSSCSWKKSIIFSPVSTRFDPSS